jgi:hypothetical protein
MCVPVAQMLGGIAPSLLAEAGGWCEAFDELVAVRMVGEVVDWQAGTGQFAFDGLAAREPLGSVISVDMFATDQRAAAEIGADQVPGRQVVPAQHQDQTPGRSSSRNCGAQRLPARSAALLSLPHTAWLARLTQTTIAPLDDTGRGR